MKLLFVILACLVAVAVAVPATKEKEPKTQTRTGKVLDDHVDTPGAGIAARWDKTKPKQNSKIVPQKEQGPFLYFREPRAHGYVAQSDIQIDGAWPVGKNWVGPRYRINKHARDDGEDDTDSDEDEQDDVDFQDDVSEEDQASFDTPSWDYLFPKHQTGQYARRNPPKSYGQGPSTYTEHGPTPPVQDAENSGYTLAVGSPGSPGYRGRSSPPGPWARQNKWAGKQVRYWTPVRGSKSYGRPERTPPSWYQGEGPVAVAYSSGNYPYGREQWVQRPVRGEREREVYYQSQYVPSPVRRRNWNTSPIVWGPRPKKVWNSAPVSVESDEEEVPQGQVPWGVQPQGPRRIKNWSKPQPWAHGQGRKQKYWGYY